MALEGRPGPWVPPGCDIVVQRTGTFGERLAGAIDDAWSLHPLPVLLIGMDTPQLTTWLVEGAARALLAPGVDTVLGPANDGGYWLIGTRAPVRRHVRRGPDEHRPHGRRATPTAVTRWA